MHEHEKMSEKTLCKVFILFHEVTLHMSWLCEIIVKMIQSHHYIYESQKIADLSEESELFLCETVMIVWINEKKNSEQHRILVVEQFFDHIHENVKQIKTEILLQHSLCHLQFFVNQSRQIEELKLKIVAD